MTPLKTIAGKIERDKHHAEGAKRIKENYARFKPKVKKEAKTSENSKSFPFSQQSHS